MMPDLEREYSPEQLAELCRRAIGMGSRLRRRRFVSRGFLAVALLVAIALPTGLILSADHPGGVTTANISLEKASVGPFENVSWRRVTYPGLNFADTRYPGNIGCNPGSEYGFRVQVEQVTYVRPASSRGTIALVLVHCNAGTPTPSSLYAFKATARTAQPQLVQTLLAAPRPGASVLWYATHFGVSKDSVSMPVTGVTGKAGICCPNVSLTMRWSYARSHFTLDTDVAPAVAAAQKNTGQEGATPPSP
jgi:hypothetical protein